uniref:Uncharacterized protein n=1 Tax=Bracon brevicornis TaxID=1563983 RepID=A0A6V7L9E8_9HYME
MADKSSGSAGCRNGREEQWNRGRKEWYGKGGGTADQSDGSNMADPPHGTVVSPATFLRNLDDAPAPLNARLAPTNP